MRFLGGHVLATVLSAGVLAIAAVLLLASRAGDGTLSLFVHTSF